MQITITGKNVDLTESLKEYVEEKITRLKRYFDHVIDVHVILSVEKFRHIADVTILANGTTIHAEEQSEDMYASIDLVADKLERQLKRYKDKLKSRGHHQPSKADRALNLNMSVLEQVSVEGGSELGEAGRPVVIRSRRFTLKPMSVEEAALQLDLIDHEFLVFTNSQNEQINVIYRRKDGNYGLIEPQV